MNMSYLPLYFKEYNKRGDNMKCPYCIKICNKCGRILVANTMNFRKDKSKKYGVRTKCRECDKKYEKEYREKNIEEIKEKDKKRGNDKRKRKREELIHKYDFVKIIESNKTWNNCPFCIKICSECKGIFVANKKNFKKGKGKYGLDCLCRNCLNKHKRKYRLNSDTEKRYRKKYYETNKDTLKQYGKQYRENNKKYFKKYQEKYRNENDEYFKQWRKNNPDKTFNYTSKRRHLEENQGDGITKEQWLEMMNFFDWRCAYSGEYIGGDNKDKVRTIDHIIPLNNGGLNEIWNCVPMYKNYNSSKHTSDMVTWYKQQDFFDIDRLMKIYEWQEYAFEKWGNY